MAKKPSTRDFVASLRLVVGMCERLYTPRQFVSLMADLGHKDVTEHAVRLMYKHPERFIKPEMVMLIKTMNFRLALHGPVMSLHSQKERIPLSKVQSTLMAKKSILSKLRRDLEILERITDFTDIQTYAVTIQYLDDEGQKKSIWITDEEQLALLVAKRGKGVLMQRIEDTKKIISGLEASKSSAPTPDEHP
jgi:hypothetical protein